ncbi:MULTISPECIES: CHASE2 domain-containing protein [Kamptonema]|uniref:CHASE2 domain-containing protein n=1 Tax=Kamptonema TaxID=1501433 RepID=UPI0001DAC8F4|nr:MULTISPECIES: adenylate/guanylate cyclase domain-containing protein [Kamptonema]CBN53838.1 putative Adenylate cyclase [Kamptonema sp. PCC 6506]
MNFKDWMVHLKKTISVVQKYLASNPPWLTGAIAAVVSVGMLQLGAWRPLEYLGYKTLFQLRDRSIIPNPGWDRRIVVIGIDDRSLQEYGQFPWSRDRYVQLLESLKKSAPTAIGFDILFIDPSPKDAELAAAIKASGNVALARTGDEENLVPEIKAAALFVGDILHESDADGISRRANLWFNGTPSFSSALIQIYNIHNPGNPILLPQPIVGVEQQKVAVNWPGKTRFLTTYGFSDVVAGKIPQDAFTNKLILVGFVAEGLDRVRTPLDRTTAGVYLHAAMIDNLLNSRLLRRVPKVWEIILLLGIGPVTSWILFHRDVKERTTIAIGLPTAWFTVAALLFGFSHWWIPIASPIGTIILAGIALQAREQYEKQQLMRLFEKHVDPETAQMIWKRKAEIFQQGELEPQEVTATVLFMDIRSFTTISEKMRPRELLTWLNTYLEAMTDCIMNRGGVVDKYIGDAIMAVFGVPFCHTEEKEIEQDAMNAIAACIDMHERLNELNKHLREEGKPLIKFGIGLHTGQLVAGSVGGARRLNYSVIGDAVNVAARLEAMNKEVTSDSPYNLLVTERTFDCVRDRYEAQKVGSIQLRGKAETTVVYAILGEKQLLTKSET